MTALLEVEDVHVTIQSMQALRGFSLTAAPGTMIGLVGRNGAGKTTLMRTLAKESLPFAGVVDIRGEVGYLPQDPRAGDPEDTARDRVLSARGLDEILRAMEKLPAMDRVMEAVAAEAATILFVEHDMDIVSTYADRVIAFYSGRVIADGSPAAVLRDPDVRRHVTGEAA